MSDFKYGEESNLQIETTCDPMQRVARRALTISRVDISAIEGRRSREQQQINIKNNVSWSMDSDHLPNKTGHVLALDMYPYVDGATSHGFRHYQMLARAMFAAASIENVLIQWGGFWTNKTDNPHWAVNREWFRKHQAK